MSWMHYEKTVGWKMKFVQRNGTIKKIVGQMDVKLRNGRETHVLISMLDRPGEKTEMQKLVETKADV